MNKDNFVNSELHVVASTELEEEVSREMAKAADEEEKSLREMLNSSDDRQDDEEGEGDKSSK